MGDILKQESIFGYIGSLLRRTKALERRVFSKDREDELGDAEDFQDGGLVENRFLFNAVKVASIVDQSNFIAQRVRPDISTPWVVDEELSAKFLPVTVPTGFAMPAEEDIVAIFFTGTYQDTSVATPIPQARYGLFGNGGVTRDFLLTAVNTDTLTGRRVDRTVTGTTVVSTEDVVIAKIDELRVSNFHGKTISGVTYTASSNNIARDAIAGSTAEIHEVTPSWVTSFTIISAFIKAGGTGIQSIVWQDENSGGRAWAQVP